MNNTPIHAGDLPPAIVNGSNITQKLAFRTKEAASLLSVSEKTLHRWRKRGLIRPMLASRHLLWPHEELVRFVKEVSK